MILFLALPLLSLLKQDNNRLGFFFRSRFLQRPIPFSLPHLVTPCPHQGAKFAA